MENKLKIFDYCKSVLGVKPQKLNFRFPIETLELLLKNFYRDYDQSSFLVLANSSINNLKLKKISKSYLLQVPVENNKNEHLYIGLSDKLNFLVVFDEPDFEKQGVLEKESEFFLTFEYNLIEKIFDYFYANYCQMLTQKEKRLLLKLKNVKVDELSPFYIGKFQEAILINALSDNNKIKQEKIVEAISFTDESISITDLNGNIIESNKNFQKSFRNSKNIKDVLGEDLLIKVINEVNENKVWQSELSINVGVKEEIFVLNSYTFSDDIGRKNGYVFSLKNISSLRRLDLINKQLLNKVREKNIELTSANKRLLDADRIKVELLSVLSHELKTPVSTIIGFSELLIQRACDKKTVKMFAEQINSSAKRLDNLLSDYLEVAVNHFGVSSDRLTTGPVNLYELITLVYRDKSLKFNDRKFNFEVNKIGYEPVIMTEASNMNKLFSNLIDNALKYSPQGGNILVKIFNDGENVTVSITDEGVGISQEHAKHVFDPFYRSDNSLTREFSGIGLGLAVCKKIVEIYNGSIWCEPDLAGGSAFYVTLPVNPLKDTHLTNDQNQSNLNERNQISTREFRISQPD